MDRNVPCARGWGRQSEQDSWSSDLKGERDNNQTSTYQDATWAVKKNKAGEGIAEVRSAISERVAREGLSDLMIKI